MAHSTPKKEAPTSTKGEWLFVNAMKPHQIKDPAARKVIRAEAMKSCWRDWRKMQVRKHDLNIIPLRTSSFDSLVESDSSMASSSFRSSTDMSMPSDTSSKPSLETEETEAEHQNSTDQSIPGTTDNVRSLTAEDLELTPAHHSQSFRDPRVSTRTVLGNGNQNLFSALPINSPDSSELLHHCTQHPQSLKQLCRF